MRKGFLAILFLFVFSGMGSAEVVGKSVRGRKIEAFVYGRGHETVLFVGGIHGDERQGIEVLNRFRSLVKRNLSSLREVRVVIVPNANPDGVRRGTRQNARGVDINRNFPTKSFTTNYQKRAYYPGERPGSEPETRVLMKLIQRYKPSLVVTLHAQLHCMMVEGDVWETARYMQYHNHYPLVKDLGYDTPGSFGQYCLERGIAMITVEVPKLPVDALWDQNKKALFEVLIHPPGKLARERIFLDSKKKPSLLEALQRQDWYVWRDIFTNMSEWKKQDSEGNTALHYAIKRGDIPLALWLIEREIHLITTNKKGWSPLFEASYRGYADVVRELLKKGISPDTKDPYGWTPLIVAAQQGHGDVVKVLLEAGASVNAQDRYGYSALMEAVRRQYPHIVEYLLACGADPHQTNRYGQTASRQAILARSTNTLVLLAGGQ
ncbi:MAG: ankyrin repeat domain-containing protein [Brevinematales bacterium]